MAEKRFVEVYSQGMTSIYKIIVDTHTGVNYLIAFNAACGSGMTVLLDAEGKPVVTPHAGGVNTSFPGASCPGERAFLGDRLLFLHIFSPFICRKRRPI